MPPEHTQTPASSTDRADDRPALHEDLLALSRRQRLSPVQRRIAHYLLDHPQEVVFLGASEFGERAGVSQASVSRFVQALGFDSYSEFIRHLRSLEHTHRDDADPAGTPNRYQDAVEDEMRNLQRLKEELREGGAVEELGAVLAASVPLVVLGLRASADVASYFTYFASKIHPDVRLITQGGSRGQDLLWYAQDAGASWLLAFALPRVPAETVVLVNEAHERGFKVAAVAAERFGALSEAADRFFYTRVGTRLVFDSQAAPMVLASAVVDAVAEANPKRTRRRLEDFESLASRERYFV